MAFFFKCMGDTNTCLPQYECANRANEPPAWAIEKALEGVKETRKRLGMITLASSFMVLEGLCGIFFMPR